MRPIMFRGIGALILVSACSSGSFPAGYHGGEGVMDGGVDEGVFHPPPSPIQPTFPATVTATPSPPPISGGTLIVSRDGHWAVAADPDRDLVYGVDLTTRALVYSASLAAGDEPGRLVEDGNQRVHVALRSSGALVTIDETTGAVLFRRSVCPAPRGVDWDASTDLVWVACATGELVALPAGGGDATRSLVVERDMRDVIATNGSLVVTSFRSADVLRLATDGTIARRDKQPAVPTFAPHVAWRAIRGPSSSLVVVHQLESTDGIATQMSGAYGGCNGGPPPMMDAGVLDDGGSNKNACPADTFANFKGVVCEAQPGAVVSALTVLDANGAVVTNRTFPATLPVDVAMSPDGSSFAAVAAGDAFMNELGSVFSFTPCGDVTASTVLSNAQATAVAFSTATDFVVQTREPAKLWFVSKGNTPTAIALSAISRDDTGHDIFHTQAGSMIACASCHPEGQEDGHVWTLDGLSRRTPSLRGTVEGTAPYHWPGNEPTLAALVNDVYTSRMNGQHLANGQEVALEGWVKSIPVPPAPSWVDATAAERGQAIFADDTVGCAGCHSGEKMTNNATMDVGTGALFQVPPLIGVGWRAPLLHDGCATTLADRFGKCATPKHGQIGNLSPANITDLVSYLQTL